MSETGTVNKHELISLIHAARGGRTMAEFATACKASPSSLSKITNGHFQRPLSINLLRSIVEAADPESGVTLDKLMEANGRVTRTDNSRILSDRKDQIENDMLVTISHSLLKRFQSVSLLDPIMSFAVQVEDTRILPPFPDGLYMVKNTAEVQWAFVVFTNLDSEFDNATSLDIVNNIIARYFLAESWNPDFFEDKRVTFSFCSKKAYEHFREQYTKAPVHHYFSFALINCADKMVVEETVIGQCSDNKATSDLVDPRALSPKQRLELLD